MTPDDTDPSSNLTRWIGLISQRVDAYERFYPRLVRRIDILEAQVQDLKKALASPRARRAENRKRFPRE